MKTAVLFYQNTQTFSSPGLLLLHLVGHLVLLQPGEPVETAALSAGSLQLPWVRRFKVRLSDSDFTFVWNHSHGVWLWLTHHWSFKISRHIAPVTELILGCQILVMKRTYEREVWGVIKITIVLFRKKNNSKALFTLGTLKRCTNILVLKCILVLIITGQGCAV